jgi:hypothetical protein
MEHAGSIVESGATLRLCTMIDQRFQPTILWNLQYFSYIGEDNINKKKIVGK